MMISLFFPFIFLKTPQSSQGFFLTPPSRDVDLSKENIIAPPPPTPALSQISRHPDIKLFLNLLHVWMENLDQWTTICQGRKLIISQKQQKRQLNFLQLLWFLRSWYQNRDNVYCISGISTCTQSSQCQLKLVFNTTTYLTCVNSRIGTSLPFSSQLLSLLTGKRKQPNSWFTTL